MTVSPISTDTGGFRPVRQSDSAPLYRGRPEEDEPYVEFSDEDGFACFVHALAVRSMTTWGLKAAHDEVIGRLGGRVCEDAVGQYVLVECAAVNVAARGGPGAVIADRRGTRS